MREDAALEIGIEFVFDESRQASAVRLHLGGERLIVRPHQLVKRCLFGAAALVSGLAGDGGALQRCAHERPGAGD